MARLLRSQPRRIQLGNFRAFDLTPPTELSAAVPSAGTTVVVTFTESGSPPVLPASGITGFTCLVNGVSRSISSATRTASTQITLTLASPVVYIGDTVRISYSGGNVTDSAAVPNSLATFSNATVTNSSTQAAMSTTQLTLERGQAGQSLSVHLLGATATATSDFTLTGSTITAIDATDTANPIITVTAATSTGVKTLTHVATGATCTITVNDTTAPDSPGGLTFSTPPTTTYAFTFSWNAIAPAPSGEAITYTVKKGSTTLSAGQAGTTYAVTGAVTGDVYSVYAADTTGNTSSLTTLTFTAPASGAGGGTRIFTGGRL